MGERSVSALREHMKLIYYVGLDAHNESFAVAIAPSDSIEVRRWGILDRSERVRGGVLVISAAARYVQNGFGGRSTGSARNHQARRS